MDPSTGPSPECVTPRGTPGGLSVTSTGPCQHDAISVGPCSSTQVFTPGTGALGSTTQQGVQAIFIEYGKVAFLVQNR